LFFYGVEVQTTKNKSKERQKEIKEERVGIPFCSTSTLDEPLVFSSLKI
jgi:hypothetical protein